MFSLVGDVNIKYLYIYIWSGRLVLGDFLVESLVKGFVIEDEGMLVF